MSGTGTGGPAYPVHAKDLPYGMTIRDAFALKALPTVIEILHDSDDRWTHADAAADAYSLADAMLAARSAK